MAEPYDPLDYKNLARSVVDALLATGATSLPPADRFTGSGVYAVYYLGDLPYYAGYSSADLTRPIYVGKAIPTGGRKGSPQKGAGASSELFHRLKQHAKSIEQAKNLNLHEFRCRSLVVMPVWISLAERFLVEHFRPVWNTVVDGFGNHDPGRGRLNMRRPRWDVVHPGRPWATRLKAEETVEDIIRTLDRPAP